MSNSPSVYLSLPPKHLSSCSSHGLWHVTGTPTLCLSLQHKMLVLLHHHCQHFLLLARLKGKQCSAYNIKTLTFSLLKHFEHWSPTKTLKFISSVSSIKQLLHKGTFKYKQAVTCDLKTKFSPHDGLSHSLRLNYSTTLMAISTCW